MLIVSNTFQMQMCEEDAACSCKCHHIDAMRCLAAAVPGYKAVPGIIGRSIYNGSLQANWTILTTSLALPLIQQEGPSGGAPSNSTGLCVDMTAQVCSTVRDRSVIVYVRPCLSYLKEQFYLKHSSQEYENETAVIRYSFGRDRLLL